MNRIKKTTLLKCSEDLFNCIEILLVRLDAVQNDETKHLVAEWREQHFVPTLSNNDTLQGLVNQKEIP